MFLNKAVRTNHINSVIIYIEDSIPFFAKTYSFSLFAKRGLKLYQVYFHQFLR